MAIDVVPSTSTLPTTLSTQAPASSDELPGWGIALIILGCLIMIAALAVGAFLLFRKIREQRRNHGEYRPQFEENLHAKNLPYISPPNIEGLI